MCSTHIFDQNKHSYTCTEVVFNQQTNVTWSDRPASILGLFCFFKRLDWGTRINFQKRDRKGTLEQGVTQLFFVYYQPKFHNGFTFTTTRCSFQLTHCILTFCVRSLKTTNFIACWCRFANNFFCKITACGPLLVILLKNVYCQLLLCKLFCQ